MMLTAVNLVQQRGRTEGVRYDAPSVRISGVTGGQTMQLKKELNSEKFENKIKTEIPVSTGWKGQRVRRLLKTLDKLEVNTRLTTELCNPTKSDRALSLPPLDHPRKGWLSILLR